MNTIDSVIQKVATSSVPSKSKHGKLEKISNEIQKEILNFKDKRVSKVIVGGSFAKGTWLESDTDIDFFVMIEPNVERAEFEELGKSVGYYALKKYKPYLRYSEHPYVEGKVDGIIFFRDPLGKHPHEPDIQMLMRICDLYNVPLATNPATGGLILDGLLASI